MTTEAQAEPQRETVAITNERGEVREYELVSSRIKRFRADHPDWTISASIVDCDDEKVRMCARIGFNADSGFCVLATGHAEEYRMDSQINETSALEVCETSAIGRALAFLGYGSDKSIASAEEVVSAKKKRAVIDDREPGALVLLQNAAKKGLKTLEDCWTGDLSKDDRLACARYMPALKRQAAKVDNG